MDLERFRRWQWALIGLAVGLMLAATRSFYEPEYFGKSLDENFNVYAAGTPTHPAGAPVAPGAWFLPPNWFYLSDLVVHVPSGQFKGKPIYWVTGVLHQVKPVMDPKTGGFAKEGDGWKFEPITSEEFFHRALVPYKVDKTSYPDVMAYLNSLTKGGVRRYRFAWWEKPAVIWTVYPLAGVVAIGGIWPMVVSLMIGAGLGRKRLEAAAVPATPMPIAPATIDVAISPPTVQSAPLKGFGTQEDQFYPTEVHQNPGKK